MSLVLVLMIAGLLFLGVSEAAPAQKVHRVGVLVTDDQFMPVVEGFKSKMTESGYQEAKNISYIVYNAQQERERLEDLTHRLLQAEVDVVFVTSTTATVPVARLTAGAKMPVVFIVGGNPLAFVQSYASSGNNLTGVSAAAVDLVPKRLELLKQLAPGVRRVASFNNPHGVNYQESRVAVKTASKKLKFSVVEVNAADREEIQRVASQITPRVADAIFLPPDATISKEIDVIIKQALQKKLPLIPSFPSYVAKGGLASYGPDYFALGQQGADLVHKVLSGVKPSELPVEQPHKLHLVINLTTARFIGLSIPREILLRADEVIP